MQEAPPAAGDEFWSMMDALMERKTLKIQMIVEASARTAAR